MKMYIRCYSAVGQKSHPPIHQSNLHCFLLGVKDSKINGATLQPKWLCLHIWVAHFRTKNMEKHHFFHFLELKIKTQSISFPSVFVHLCDLPVMFSAPHCSRLPAANVDMPRCRCDFPRRPGKCLSLIHTWKRLKRRLWRNDMSFSPARWSVSGKQCCMIQ